jgi:hypothetical protein
MGRTSSTSARPGPTTQPTRRRGRFEGHDHHQHVEVGDEHVFAVPTARWVLAGEHGAARQHLFHRQAALACLTHHHLVANDAQVRVLAHSLQAPAQARSHDVA